MRNHALDEYLGSLPRKRIAAGVLLRDQKGRIVLIEPTYKTTWEIPGGVVEVDESPWLAAERELEEELGLARRNMPVLVIDHVPTAPDGMPEGLLWIFDGGLLSEAESRELRGDGDEVKTVHLVELEEAVKHTNDSLGRRLRVALEAALTLSAPVYGDRGRPRRIASPPYKPSPHGVERL